MMKADPGPFYAAWMRFLMISLILSCGLRTGRAAASDPGADQDGVTYTVSSQLVQIFLTATEDGRSVLDLKAPNLTITENGVPKPIDRLDSGDVPLQIVLLFDISGSMQDSLPVIQEAAAYFIDSLHPADRVTLVLFNSDIRSIPQYTDDRGPLLRAIRGARARGATKLYEALLFGMKHLEGRQGRKAIVVFSDGEDTARTASLPLVLNAAARYGFPIYAIGAGAGLRSEPLRSVLRQLAAINSGKMYFEEDPKELRSSFEQVALELRAAYVLNYYTQVPSDGRWHEVRIQASSPRLKIHCRKGFYAREGSSGGDPPDKPAVTVIDAGTGARRAGERTEIQSAAATEVLRTPLPERALNEESLRAALPPGPQPERVSRRPVFRVESRLVEVPVLLESTAGKELPRLSERDFRIYEDDALREICFFSRIQATQSASELREAASLRMRSRSADAAPARPSIADVPLGRMHLLLDDMMTDAASFLRVKEAAEKIIRENHHPLRPVALHLTSHSSAVLNSDETADAMIQKIRRVGARSSAQVMSSNEIMSIYEAYLVERNDSEAVQLAELRQAALMQVSFTNSLGSVEGQSEGNPEVIRSEVSSTVTRVLMENASQLSRALDGLQAVVSAAAAERGDYPRTVVFISSGFSMGRGSGRADFGSRFDRIVSIGKKAGVRVFSVDASGLFVRDSIGSGADARFLATNPHLQGLLERHTREWEFDRQNPLSQIATESGGRFINSTNDLTSAAGVAVRTSADLYYLAYVSRQPADGRYHRIRVTASAPAAKIHGRKGYYAGRSGGAADGGEAIAEEDWKALLEGAREARRSGDLSTAAAHLQKLTRRFPSEISLWYNLGVVHMQLGNSAVAADAFQSALAIAPDDKIIGSALARALLASGFVEAAADTMEAVIRKHPADIDLLIQLGRIYESDGDALKAYQVYRRTLDLTATPPLDVYVLLLRTGLDLGRQAEALIFIRDYTARGGDPAVIESLRNQLAGGSPQ